MTGRRKRSAFKRRGHGLAAGTRVALQSVREDRAVAIAREALALGKGLREKVSAR